jgi:hypothetical protein
VTAQKRFAGAGTDLKMPVAGSQTCGFRVRLMASTRPSGRSIVWIATMGHSMGAVHWPLSVAMVWSVTGLDSKPTRSGAEKTSG